MFTATSPPSNRRIGLVNSMVKYHLVEQEKEVNGEGRGGGGGGGEVEGGRESLVFLQGEAYSKLWW